MEEAAVPYYSHMVLHRNGKIGTSVILQNGDIDPHITVQDSLMHLGTFHLLALGQRNIAVVAFQMGGHYFGAGRLGGSFNAAVLIALLPVVASMVEDRHFLGACSKALLHDFGNQLRIGIACQFRNFIPADVGFYNHFLPGFDKAFHAAQFCNGPAKHNLRLATHHGNHIHFTTAGIGKCLSQHIHCF